MQIRLIYGAHLHKYLFDILKLIVEICALSFVKKNVFCFCFCEQEYFLQSMPSNIMKNEENIKLFLKILPDNYVTLHVSHFDMKKDDETDFEHQTDNFESQN